MTNKKFWSGMLVLALVFGMFFISCGGSDTTDPEDQTGPTDPSGPTGTTYTVTANGTADTVTTTQLSFTFSASVSGLTATDIIITDGTGSASKGTLTGSGTSWNLNITTVNTAGTIKVKIVKTGIENDEKTVTIHKIVPNGSSRELAIPLLDTQWENGSVATGEAKWYKFQSTNNSYRVQWKDKDDKPASDDYTASVKVTAYESNGTTNISTINGSTSGWTSPKTVSGGLGTVYLKVETINSSSAGTYTIRFYDVASVIPQSPMSISSVSATPVSVVVTWNSVTSASGVSGFRVYRSNTETGAYTQVGSDITSYLTTHYTDTNVSAGSTYWYKVAAYNSSGEGDKSDAKQSDAVPSASDVSSISVSNMLSYGGTLSTVTQVDWYKFTAPNRTCYVSWRDSTTSTFYPAWIKVSAFKSDGTLINISHFSSIPITVSEVSGIVYIKVEVYSTISDYIIRVSYIAP